LTNGEYETAIVGMDFDMDFDMIFEMKKDLLIALNGHEKRFV
jgi:hypothetical protein